MPSENSQAAETPDPAKLAADAASFKKKLVLVVVLLLGLVVAIVTQPDKEADEQALVVEANVASHSSAAPSPPQPSDPEVKSPEDAASRTRRITQIHELSRIEIEEAVNLELLAPDVPQANQQFTSTVKHVQAVYGTDSDRAALVGESIVRGGQPLPSGAKVISVTDDGIRIGRQ